MLRPGQTCQAMSVVSQKTHTIFKTIATTGSHPEYLENFQSVHTTASSLTLPSSGLLLFICQTVEEGASSGEMGGVCVQMELNQVEEDIHMHGDTVLEALRTRAESGNLELRSETSCLQVSLFEMQF